MLIRQLKDCPEFIAGDACHLRELLNAKTDKRAYRYSLAHAIVKPGIKTKPHSLKTSEVYYILEGQGRSQYLSISDPLKLGPSKSPLCKRIEDLDGCMWITRLRKSVPGL